ncbi:MAG TPA: AAA family ATPase [Pirellulales bacterium]|nr:AAA family ATPase [Pirellulales bacterium]
MIESIHLSGVATFGTTPSVLDGLSTFNYIYGANGSGKTTVSRVIADAGRFPSCIVNWKARSPLEPLVYNRDFVDKHFRESTELPGIFTLGEKDTEAADRIAKAKIVCDRLSQEIIGLKGTLEGADGNGGKVGELAVAEDAFKDACWKQKQAHDGKFKAAFEGFRNNAERFKAKVLDERAKNTADKKTLAYIVEKAATVFCDDVKRIDTIATFNGTALLGCEHSAILAKKVVGKTDVDIAAMIDHLSNSDWVRNGRVFFESNDGKCPFCQQDVTDGFAESLAAYFDESFEADSKAIDAVVTTYAAEVQSLAGLLDVLLANPPSLLDHSALTTKKKLFDAHIKINQQLLREKKKEPSRSVELQSSKELVGEILGIIANANTAIAGHNVMVTNLATERTSLKEQVWKYLLDEALKDAIATYATRTSELGKAIANLKKQIQEKDTAKRNTETELRTLERDVTSIQPTIAAINGLLSSFGFHGFYLAQSDNKRCYKLVRADGTDAKATLSEGEKTFVTFLYFYHLLKGSPSESGIATTRVVVFDDPVSSLDSDILFIVSTLIRRVCEDVRSGSASVKQVFVLTHNVYFHKEVTFQKARGSGTLKEETFWIVRKANDQSQIAKHASNPIKSSYELLWLDVRDATPGNHSIQNSLRRILETYFKMLGGIDLDRIHEQFDGNEKLACRALVSWVNDGSHSAHDDLYIAVDDSTVALYLDVFRKIFDGAGHIEHYNMMMAGPTTSTAIGG